MAENRNNTIDYMRTLAIFLVISAHCFFPYAYMEIRTFDVPMLIFISGCSYYLNSKNDEESYFNYVIKRFRKLILTVWIFISIYLAFFSIFFKEVFSLTTIITSYGLTSGIGYVWIYRIVFVVALLNPILLKIAKKYSFNKSLLLIFIVLSFNEMVIFLIIQNINIEKIRSLLYILTSYNVGYAIISFSGIVWCKSNSRERHRFAFYSSIVFIGTSIYLSFPSLQVYKYPPQFYFIVYGLAVTSIIYLLVDRYVTCKSNVMGIVRWLSKNVMSIYLCHVFTMRFIYYLNSNLLTTNKLIYFSVIVSISILLTYLQVKIIARFRGVSQ